LPNNSANATTNVAERKTLDKDWNAYGKNVSFTCPEGHVLEYPDAYNEQDVPHYTFELRCDADRRWRPVLLNNVFPNLPVMPRCIRKCFK